MKKKKNNPKMERREEKLHKDLDGDNEKGEPMAHQKKVMAPSKPPVPPSAPLPAPGAKGGKKKPAFVPFQKKGK